MNNQLDRLRIASEQKRRPRGTLWIIFGTIAVVAGVVAFFAFPRASDNIRSGMKSSRELVLDRADKDLAKRAEGLKSSGAGTTSGASGTSNSDPAVAGPASLLTVSGYIIARERIEISPRFMGVVSWMGVKKGDAVTNGQVVVRLDDAEYRARLKEIDGQLAAAQIGVEKARLDFGRAEELVRQRVEMAKTLDDARLDLAAREADVRRLEGARDLILTYLDWCIIRSPVTGVVLEKLADANELVTPQNFGGTSGPSTSLLAVADLTDLQVEIDLNEADLGKISLGQPCRVSPEAYPDKVYAGRVAEIAPEASRQKGTLQVKVQIEDPDRFLTPELSAKVEFLPRN